MSTLGSAESAPAGAGAGDGTALRRVAASLQRRVRVLEHAAVLLLRAEHARDRGDADAHKKLLDAAERLRGDVRGLALALSARVDVAAPRAASWCARALAALA